MTKAKRKRKRTRMVKRQIYPLDIDMAIGSGDVNISGSAQDLIRDTHDNALRWVHNSEALPDDREKVFLVGRGWSATPEKRARLQTSGIPWMAVNDYPRECKPDFFCTGDPAVYFGERIWNDTSVLKFAPMAFRKTDRAREDAYAPLLHPTDAPNTHFFHHVNNETEYESWLHTPWVAWGTNIFGPRVPRQFYEHGAARSSMLIGLRLLWHLGFREVYLLGCDCTNHPAPEYWNAIFHITEQLVPTFKRFNYNVYQTNPDAHLRSFPFADFDRTVAEP